MDSLSSRVEVGGWVLFQCSPGFELRGSDSLQCLDRDQWSGMVPRCEERRCPTPSQPYGGSWYPITSSQGNFSTGTNITLRCNPGLRLAGIDPRMICGLDGTWSERQASCEGSDEKEVSSITQSSSIIGGVVVGAVLILLAFGAAVAWRTYSRRTTKPTVFYIGVETGSAVWVPTGEPIYAQPFDSEPDNRHIYSEPQDSLDSFNQLDLVSLGSNNVFYSPTLSVRHPMSRNTIYEPVGTQVRMVPNSLYNSQDSLP